MVAPLGGGTAGGAMFGIAPATGPAPGALPPMGQVAPGNYQLQGALPFQAAGNPFSQNLGEAYQSSYNAALAQNQALYGNILQGYNQALANQQQAQRGIVGGYGALKGEVLGQIQGIGASQAQQIQDVYAQQRGAQQQQLTSAGLGNTTVQGSMMRGLTLDEQKAQIALANQMAQLQAGYSAQLGSAGLAYQGQAAAANTGEMNQALGWMNTVNAAYPNAQSYAQLQYNQGLMNALQSRAGINAVPGGLYGAGIGGGGLRPVVPNAPPNIRYGNPLDYGGGGAGLSTFEGGAGTPSPAVYGPGSTLNLAQNPLFYPGEGDPNDPLSGNYRPGGYAGTSQDYLTDTGAYSSQPSAALDLGGGDYGTAYA